MRWVLGVAGLLIVLVVAVVAIGYLLPQSHVASSSARYRASPDALWASLTDVAAFPTWRKGVTRVELLPDENGQRGWREHSGGETITFRIVEADPPRRLVSRIADQNLPFGGRWIYDLAPVDSGANDHRAGRDLQSGLPLRLPIRAWLHVHHGRCSPGPRDEARRGVTLESGPTS